LYFTGAAKTSADQAKIVEVAEGDQAGGETNHEG
jgi:hypothetical protein